MGKPSDALDTLGTVFERDLGRDAVHVAAISVQAPHSLRAGEHVDREGRAHHHNGTLVGIVDPFLTEPVERGEWFWLCLYPRTITGLSHVWSHPEFADTVAVAAPSKEASEAWLREFCDDFDVPDYDTVMNVAARRADGEQHWDSEYLHFNEDAVGSIPNEFWDHVEVVLGRPIKGVRAKYFSCSC